jgi:hypothetical protein
VGPAADGEWKVKDDEESAEEAGREKLAIKPNGKAKKALNRNGKAKVKRRFRDRLDPERQLRVVFVEKAWGTWNPLEVVNYTQIGSPHAQAPTSRPGSCGFGLDRPGNRPVEGARSPCSERCRD